VTAAAELTYPVNGHRCIDCPKCGQAVRVERRRDTLIFTCYGGCDEAVIAPLIENKDQILEEVVANAARDRPNGQPQADAPAVTFTDTKPPKLQLPPVPEPDDPAGLAKWLTTSLNLDVERHQRSWVPIRPCEVSERRSGDDRGGLSLVVALDEAVRVPLGPRSPALASFLITSSLRCD
jgi:hypothetical protein